MAKATNRSDATNQSMQGKTTPRRVQHRRTQTQRLLPWAVDGAKKPRLAPANEKNPKKIRKIKKKRRREKHPRRPDERPSYHWSWASRSAVYRCYHEENKPESTKGRTSAPERATGKKEQLARKSNWQERQRTPTCLPAYPPARTHLFLARVSHLHPHGILDATETIFEP